MFTEITEKADKTEYVQESVRPKHAKADSKDPKHKRVDNLSPKHLKASRSRRKKRIIKSIIALELISVILACSYVYRLWCHNIEVRIFGDLCSATLANASAFMSTNTDESVKSFMESVPEDIYEYVWTTAKVKYRTGADKTYKSAGTLAKDKMILRTGITHSGWNRIVVDDKEYYIPADKVSSDIPSSLPIADGVKGEYQKYALSLFPDFGWDSSELEPLIYLWNRESGWNPNSHNKRSGAHGIPQALPGSKMASEGSDYYTNPEPQIRWGLKYIAGRYGSPSSAWAHWQSRGWY